MSEKNMRDYTQNYIDGTSVVSAGGETIDVINQQRNSPRGRSRVTANAAAFLALDHASYVNGDLGLPLAASLCASAYRAA
jgi:hypothetical protein